MVAEEVVMFRQLLPAQTSPHHRVDFQEEFAKRMELLALSDDKKKVIHNLSEAYDFHIISSTNTETVAKFCERNGIRHYFGDILGHDVAASKVEKLISLLTI